MINSGCYVVPMHGYFFKKWVSTEVWLLQEIFLGYLGIVTDALEHFIRNKSRVAADSAFGSLPPLSELSLTLF